MLNIRISGLQTQHGCVSKTELDMMSTQRVLASTQRADLCLKAVLASTQRANMCLKAALASTQRVDVRMRYQQDMHAGLTACSEAHVRMKYHRTAIHEGKHTAHIYHPTIGGPAGREAGAGNKQASKYIISG